MTYLTPPSPGAALFVTVAGLRFPLACVVSILAATVLLLLNPDRSVGGRIFGGALLCGSGLAGLALGGSVVSLAFLARGDAEPLMSYLPDQLQKVGAYPQAAAAELTRRVAAGIAQHSLTKLPPGLEQEVGGLVGCLGRRAGGGGALAVGLAGRFPKRKLARQAATT